MSKAIQISSLSVAEYIKQGKTVYGLNLCYPKDGVSEMNNLAVSDYFEMMANESAFFWIIEEEWSK